MGRLACVRVTVRPGRTTRKAGDPRVKPEDDRAKPEDDGAKPEDDRAKPEDGVSPGGDAHAAMSVIVRLDRTIPADGALGIGPGDDGDGNRMPP
ncbi:hypothetical protein [Sediminimonas sp.]|uniref:hypothetical protein n=1 Tax=Sediminimonas sp. TaxID=2823379 RepID=UPI0025DED7D4|nr:hypothetical protein [Sediminimonas sp.]